MVVHKTVALKNAGFQDSLSFYEALKQFIGNNRNTLPGLSVFFDVLNVYLIELAQTMSEKNSTEELLMIDSGKSQTIRRVNSYPEGTTGFLFKRKPVVPLGVQLFSQDEGPESPSSKPSINAVFTRLFSEFDRLNVAIERSRVNTSEDNCKILMHIIDYFHSILARELSKRETSLSDLELSKENFERELKQFGEFKLTVDEFDQLAKGSIQILHKKRKEAFWVQNSFGGIHIKQAWANLLILLKAPEFHGVLREVPLYSFFSSGHDFENISMIIPNRYAGLYQLKFLTLDLDQLNLCHPENLNFDECRIYLKWIIAFLQMKAGLITSYVSLGDILESYVSGGIMALVVGAEGTAYHFPFGVSIGSVEHRGAIRYKGQYLLPALQGHRVSALMDQLILKQLIQKYQVHFPLNLTARSTTLAVLAKIPGFLDSLHQLAQFMRSLHALYDSRCDEMYKTLQVLMVNCDSGLPQIREFLTYINGFGVGSDWRFEIQIELYQLLVRILSGANVLEAGFQSEVDALNISIKERYGLSLSVETLLNLYGAVKNSDFVMSPYRLLALCRAIAKHAPTQQRSFSEDDVRTILKHYNGILYPGRSSGSMYSGLGVSFNGLEISKVSHFFVQLQRLYFQFRLADINVHFGFDLLVLFASQKQDYGRVGQWNKQLDIQQYLCCLSIMKKSVLGACLSRYLGNASGALTPELFSQLLLSGIQTGAYFEFKVPIEEEILEEYFKLTCPSADILRRSKAYDYISSALVRVLEHILFLSDREKENGSTELIQTRKVLFSLDFLKKMETLNELFSPPKESCWRVISLAICRCFRSQTRPIRNEWPKDLDLRMIHLGRGKRVIVSYFPWKSGWAAPLHALYGVSSIIGEAPLVTDANYEFDECIESVVTLLIYLAKDTLPDHMSDKIRYYTPYLKCATKYLLKVGILKTTDGFSKCSETDDENFINTNVDRNHLEFSPDILASLFFLRDFVKNNGDKGLCIVVEGDDIKVFDPPGSEFERSNAIYIAYDPKSDRYARLKHRSILSNTFDGSFQRLSQGGDDFSPTDLIPYLCDRFSFEHWHSVAHNSVKKALAFYFRHHDPDEYEYKQKALVDDLRHISEYLKKFPNIESLKAFWKIILVDGPVYKILCNTFSNMDRQASAR